MPPRRPLPTIGQPGTANAVGLYLLNFTSNGTETVTQVTGLPSGAALSFYKATASDATAMIVRYTASAVPSGPCVWTTCEVPAARTGFVLTWNGRLANGAKAYSGRYTWTLTVHTADSATAVPTSSSGTVPGSSSRSSVSGRDTSARAAGQSRSASELAGTPTTRLPTRAT